MAFLTTLVMSLALVSFSATAQSSMKAPSEGRLSAPRKALDLPDEKPDFTMDYRLGLYGRGVSDSLEKSVATGLSGAATLNYHPETWIGAVLTPGMVIESGSLASLYDSNQPRNQVYLDQAELQLKPLDFFTFSAGAINQRFLASPLLLDSQSFPAVMEKLHFGDRAFKASLTAQQAIPTSLSMSTMTSDKEPLPTLMTETVQIEINANRDVKFTARGTRFDFVNLPTQVAYKSQLNGNTCISGDVPQSKRFTCQYAGYTGGGQMDIRLAKAVVVSGGGDYIINTSAPADESQGFLTFGQLKFPITPTWRVIPRGEFFYNQGDTSPAFYNAVAYGHSNRQGYAADLRVENLKHGFAVRARYVDARLVETNPNQADTTIFFLGLELFGAGI